MKFDIKLMSYNFNEKFNNWKLRKTLINELLNNIEFDILCAQEFTSKMDVNVFPKLCDYQIIPSFNVPIFVHKKIQIMETFENLDILTRFLDNPPKKHGHRFNAAILKYEGKSFIIVNVHLHHKYLNRIESHRALEVFAIDDFLKKHELIKNVICGDFNCLPYSLPIKLMAEKGYQDVHKGLVVNETYNGYGSHSGDKIDYIFTKCINFNSSNVISKQVQGMFPSDHNPIFTTLNI